MIFVADYLLSQRRKELVGELLHVLVCSKVAFSLHILLLVIAQGRGFETTLTQRTISHKGIEFLQLLPWSSPRNPESAITMHPDAEIWPDLATIDTCQWKLVFDRVLIVSRRRRAKT